MRLFRAITLMLVSLTAVPITVVGFILIDSSVDTLKTLTWELQQERADHAARAVGSFFENILNDLDLLLSNLSLANMSLRQRQEFLSFVLQKRQEINVIALYSPQGHALRNLLAFDSSRILPSELAEHQAHLSKRLQRAGPARVVFSRPYTIERPARPTLGIEARHETAVALVLRQDAGDAAFLGMEVSLASLQTLMEHMHVGERGQAMLLDSDGTLISGKLGRAVATRLQAASSRRVARFLAHNLEPQGADANARNRVSGARPLRLADGRAVLAAYAPLARPPWLIVALEPLDEAYAATRRMTLQVVTVVLISMALAIAIGVLFAFGITRPIGRCVSGALAIARGKFGTTISVNTRNEIGELAHTFNYMSEQLLYYDNRNQELLASLERGYLETIQALANSIDAKDPYTRGHSQRVTNTALAIGRRLKLDGQQLRFLRYGGILHDIGKIGIQETILAKKDRLDDEERRTIQNHPLLGEKIIAPIDFLNPVRPLIRHHHEWYDGSGYPDGLRGEDIPLGARIISAADTYDAVTSERPYQKAVNNQEAIAILEKLRLRQLDPRVCDALVAIIKERIAAGELQPGEWEGESTEPSSSN